MNEDEDLDIGLDFEFDEEEELKDYKPMDLNLIKQKLPTYSSEKLCEMIVCDRYFGCFREIAVMCMEELAGRRAAGSDFDFESLIDKQLAELPKLETVAVPDLGDVLRQFAVGKGYGR